MKKITLLILLLVFITGCQLVPTGLINGFPKGDFDVKKQCPHVCWLGINPGKTTIEQAKSIISISNQIDQSNTQISGDSITAYWIWGEMKDDPSEAYIQFESGIVKTISLGPLPYKMQDFINLLGEPDNIIAWDLERADGYEIGYQVYFQAQNIVIQVMAGGENGNWNGPDPNDNVFAIWLNTELKNDVAPPRFGIIRPWLGYGHIKDYLPGGIQYPPTDTP